MNRLKKILAKTWSFAKPAPCRELFWLLGLYSIVQFAYMGVVLYKHEFKLSDPTVFAFFAQKYLVDLAIFMASCLLLLRVFKSYIWALVLAVAYFVLFAANSLVYLYGSTLLELHYFSLITPYSIGSFVTFQSVGFALVFAVLCWMVRYPLKTLWPKARWAGVVRWSVLAAALIMLDGALLFSERKKEDDRLDKVVMVFRNAQLEYATQNPVAAFANDIVLRGISESLYTMKGSDTYRKYMKKYNLVQDDYEISSDITEHRETIDRYGLPIGERSYEDLKLKPFNKVVILLTESLSLDMMHCYNSRTKTHTTDYLCSDEIREKTFSNFHATASPTLQGITNLFSSHPNYNIQKLTGDRLSMLGPMRKAGFSTLFLRSASKFFANENIVFKKWGFQKIEAREDFHRRKELRKYIYGWGLEDRMLYEELIERLKKYKDDKLFVTVLGTDTHPLHGQRHFKHLKYPPLPSGFNKKWGRARSFMKAIRFMDHDISRLVSRMKEEGVFTDDTLIVITSDHSCPPNAVTRRVPGHTVRSLGKIPFILITPQKLPEFRNRIVASQLDVAPTIFHMLNIPVPKGWWGESVFYKGKSNPFVGLTKNMVRIERNEDKKLIRLKKLKSDEEKAFYKLFSTVIVD